MSSLRLIGLLALCGSAYAPLSAQWNLSIIHNNDGESQLLNAGSGIEDFGGISRFVTAVNETRTILEGMGNAVVTISSGDNFLPGPEFEVSLQNVANGGKYYDALGLNAIGYDAIVLGNHDFDFGPDLLADFIDDVDASIPYLGANFDFSGSALAPLAGSRIKGSTIVERTVQIGGSDVTKRIGIVGGATQNLKFITSLGSVQVNPVVPALQAEIDHLRDVEGVDTVILASHLQGISSDKNVISQLRGVDVAIAGGGDEILANPGTPLVPGDTAVGPYPATTFNSMNIRDADGNDVPVVSTGGNYKYAGVLNVEFDADGNIVGLNGDPIRIIANDSPLLEEGETGFGKDSTVEATVEAPVQAGVAVLDEQKIGSTRDPLDGRRSQIRLKETNQGNLIADAHLTAAQQRADEFGVEAPVVAFANGGGIRNDDFRDGELSVLDTFDISPFANKISVTDVTGEELKLLFENAYSKVYLNAEGELSNAGSDGTGRFAQVSRGTVIEIDLLGAPLQLDEDGNILQIGDRIETLILADGTPVVIDGELVFEGDITIATLDFLMRGGDQYFFFDEEQREFTDLGVTDQQALREYIEDTLSGDIRFPQYSTDVNDRIFFLIPEPSVLSMMGAAFCALLLVVRRRK